jgi:hypothetical protein
MPVRRNGVAVAHGNGMGDVLHHMRTQFDATGSEAGINEARAQEAAAQAINDRALDRGCALTARKRKALERQIARASGVGPSCVVVYERESRNPRIRVTMPPIQVSAEMRDYWLTQGIRI